MSYHSHYHHGHGGSSSNRSREGDSNSRRRWSSSPYQRQQPHYQQRSHQINGRRDQIIDDDDDRRWTSSSRHSSHEYNRGHDRYSASSSSQRHHSSYHAMDHHGHHLHGGQFGRHHDYNNHGHHDYPPPTAPFLDPRMMFNNHSSHSYDNFQSNFQQRQDMTMHHHHHEGHHGSHHRSQESVLNNNGDTATLQERTLKVTNFDLGPSFDSKNSNNSQLDKDSNNNMITKDLLRELFIQAGPLRNVVLKRDHAFIEFVDKESVSFALGLFHGITLFGRQLILEPKVQCHDSFAFLDQVMLYQENPHLFVTPTTTSSLTPEDVDQKQELKEDVQT